MMALQYKMDPHDHHLTSSNGRNGGAGAIYESRSCGYDQFWEHERSDGKRNYVMFDSASLEGSSNQVQSSNGPNAGLHAKSQGMLQ